MLNSYFSQGNPNEQALYRELLVESIQIHGQNVEYLPRTVISENQLGEPDQSRFDTHFEIEAYIDTANYVSSETVFSKFGIEIRDHITLILAKERWKTQVGSTINQLRPNEGDLVYIPLLKSLFEIEFVDHENPNFYQFNDLPIYKLELELFEYSGEQLNTGLYDIDKLEYTFGSGGTKMVVEFDSKSVNLNRMVLGNFYSQTSGNDTARGKLYSIRRVDGSQSRYEVVFGQTTGIFNSSAKDLLVEENGSGHRFKIVKIYRVSDENTDSYTDNDAFPNDPQAENIMVEQLSDKIIDFSESNPFGEI